MGFTYTKVQICARQFGYKYFLAFRLKKSKIAQD